MALDISQTQTLHGKALVPSSRSLKTKSHSFFRSFKMIYLTFITLFLVPSVVLGQVRGSAPGYAHGTTGGGNAAPQVPSSIQQYDPPAP